MESDAGDRTDALAQTTVVVPDKAVLPVKYLQTDGIKQCDAEENVSVRGRTEFDGLRPLSMPNTCEQPETRLTNKRRYKRTKT